MRRDGESKILFPTMKPLDTDKKVEKAISAPAAAPVQEKIDFSNVKIEPIFKDMVDFDTFSKSDFRAVKVKECEAVKKSKKLLCSQVRIGSQVKQIVSGIKSHYTPEEMVGKKVMVVVNLKPAKLAGILSEGMILCAEDAEGKLSLMTTEKDMPAGAEIC